MSWRSKLAYAMGIALILSTTTYATVFSGTLFDITFSGG